MTREDVQRIQDEIIRAVQENDYPKARRLVEALARSGEQIDAVRELLEKERKANKALQRKLEEATQPPLSRMIVLALSPDDEQSLIVGAGSQKLEVRLAPDTGIDRSSVRVGSEAWLNEDRQIRKIRGPDMIGETAEVVSVFPDGRVELTYRGNEQLVAQAVSTLVEDGLQAGDRLRVDPQLGIAFEKLPAQSNKELELDEVPDVTYEQIGGLDVHIAEIRDAIELPYLYGHLFTKYR